MSKRTYFICEALVTLFIASAVFWLPILIAMVRP